MKSNSDSLGSQFSSSDKWESHSRSASRESKDEIRSGQFADACQEVTGDGSGKPPKCNPDVYPDLDKVPVPTKN